MPRRPVFAADTPTADLLAWIASAIGEAFTGPRVLPILRRPPAEPPAPLPSLFEGLPQQRRGDPPVPMPEPAPVPAPVRQPPPPGAPLHEVMARHFKGVITPKSELAQKRARLKEERASAAAAVRQAEAAAAEPVPVPDAMERIVASGIANEYIAGLGALRDPDNRAPYSPRSIGFPVKLHRVGGPFPPPTAPRIWELHLSTPACGDLPFVRKIEEVTGLKAKWSGDPGGQWHHAVDLANDADWERLASSMEHTEPRMVADAVGMHVADGSLSVANGCRLLLAVGVEEPSDRSCPNLRINPDAGLVTSLGGWEAIYAVEDGLITPGNPKRSTRCRATDAGWRSVGKEPPTPEQLKAARKAARC